jgi:hypothetical protein
MPFAWERLLAKFYFSKLDINVFFFLMRTAIMWITFVTVQLFATCSSCTHGDFFTVSRKV